MRTILSILVLTIGLSGFAQNGQTLEEVVAVVGDNIILKSELETEYQSALAQTSFYEGDLKCEILNQLIIQKIYLHKGQMDTVEVAEEMVEAEVERRIQYYAMQAGGERNLEIYLKKTLDEFRGEMMPRVREQMIIQQVQRDLISDVKVSPTDVQTFFNKIPEDSLPTFETEISLAQVVMSPEPSDFAKKYALDKITNLRQQIIDGVYTFELAAKISSNDPGTAQNGGELGYFGRGKMVNEFERAAFSMDKDSISEVFETDFGYHILQVIDRKGEQVNARHILIKPAILRSDLEKTQKEMLRIMSQLKADSITMCEAASKYSSDPYTKDNCGYFSDPSTGSNSVAVSSLDEETLRYASELKVGEYSAVIPFINYDGTQALKFLFMEASKPSHRANLSDDYQKIQKLALEEAQDKSVEEWVESYKKGVYIWIDEKYRNCSELSGWAQED